MKINRFRMVMVMAAAVFLTGAGPLAALAGDSGPGTGESRFVQRFDGDGDGRVSASEFAGGHEKLFSRMDADGDGFINGDEAPGRAWGRGGRKGKMMARFDADGDGRLSSEEFPGPADHFGTLDTDKDGFLTADELAAGRPGPPHGGGFNRDDADDDGRVSAAEFSGPAEMFKQLDADGDGVLTREEACPRR